MTRRGDAVQALIAHVEVLARVGLDLIQIREPDLEARTLLRLVQGALEATRGTRARVVVNDRADVALAAGAAGVHLRGDSAPAARVRALAPTGWLIGCSVHTAAEAALASSTGAVDYLIAGTMFPTTSKPTDTPTLGEAGLRRICRTATVPVLAIGGLTEARARDAAAAGAGGIAAIGLFSEFGDEASAAAAVAAIRASFVAGGAGG
jgi:thiamine-phosphate pyrophosphorylase